MRKTTHLKRLLKASKLCCSRQAPMTGWARNIAAAVKVPVIIDGTPASATR
ncbi:hypothetical protein [Pseudoroseomonas ludipueritiae]|uniref:Uncharacterized protein n=1 Tax=Pseudoroseomonas ludipueritiae TaxID=198093 RepID=A0ABR7RBK1_9PROT|nr:hypothetical protein [Pseudoroseomonas ludipueritiae]MBC9179150.1 hypothetical protein [Pseudoroseomonas ludipueritiae]